ncbi:hypothetical protein KBB49_01590 [Candidatus Saccharibacteria bacterium]|jgi:hypothetical protein|nr:hypothetical protein [Candidatus Saccharibacteria bacterium]
MAKTPISTQQGSMFDQQGPTNYEVAGIHYGPVELGGGVIEGDSTDITQYLGFYVDAVRQIGRGRSNDIGFGALYTNSSPVREVAAQHDNPDKAEVQRTVVDSRLTHMNRANHILLKRSNIREANARKWQSKGALTQEDIEKIPLVEDAHMLEGKWYGKTSEVSDPEKSAERRKLYTTHKKYQKHINKQPKAA